MLLGQFVLMLVYKGLSVAILKSKELLLFIITEHVDVYWAFSLRFGNKHLFGTSFLDFKQIQGRIHYSILDYLVIILLHLMVVDKLRNLKWQLMLLCHDFRLVATRGKLTLHHAHHCGRLLIIEDFRIFLNSWLGGVEEAIRWFWSMRTVAAWQTADLGIFIISDLLKNFNRSV